jgi:hypothetical protein
MNTETEKQAHQRGYSQGYAAGRRRTLGDRVSSSRASRRKDQFFCAALTGLIQNSKWGRTLTEPDGTKNFVRHKTGKQYVAAAWGLADEAIRQRP